MTSSCLAIAFILVFLVLFVFGNDAEISDEDGYGGSSALSGGSSGGGGGGGGGSPIPELFVPEALESHPTAVLPTRARTTQRNESHATETTKGEVTWLTQATTPAPTTSTTTPQPLLCSVSETATLVSLYPDDNLCDIVMYTHVRASKNQILAVDDMDSYTTFTTVCGVKYSKTTCGISFDARFVKASQFTSDISEELALLRRQNVVHLGILNMYDYDNRVLEASFYVEPALDRITRLKALTSRVIYGIGFFFYNKKISWNRLQVLILASNAKDIIVVITCVLSVPSASACIALPPTTFRSISDYPPRFDYVVQMANDSFKPPSQVLAFAFQMGTLIYNMTYPHRRPADAVYENCSGFIIGDSSQVSRVV
ncbi:uncharacterized protein LOC142766012 [Rhipicephalus microplus]|uniref:uncharacterized protein LOC142766012 n=1 Tax=Rhipicephalus microplus TaxID=6941 RepID=UPI003F6BDAFC